MVLKGSWSVFVATVCLFTLVILSGVPNQVVLAQNPEQHSTFETQLDSLAPQLLSEYDVPGLAVGAVEKGQVLFAKGFGFADRTNKLPITGHTRCNFASTSKSVTAWGVLGLVDDGFISLDGSVNNYIRRWHFPESEFESDSVTVRRLLSHTASTSVPAVPWFPADTTLPRLEQVLQGEAGGRGPVVIEREPGTRWSYSGGGYAVLQLLVEDVTDMTFEAYMKNKIFEPLDMKSTSFAPDEVTGPGVAIPYGGGGNAINPYRLVGVAAGGLYSTTEDFARFLAAYTDFGSGLISRDLFLTMTTAEASVELNGLEVNGAEYGLGHGVHVTQEGEKIVYHSGSNPGYIAYFLVLPERGDGLVLVCNSSNAVPVIREVLNLWSESYETELPPLY